MIDLFVFLFEYFDQLQYEICLQRTLIECVLRVRSCRPARSRVGLHPQHIHSVIYFPEAVLCYMMFLFLLVILGLPLLLLEIFTGEVVNIKLL